MPAWSKELLQGLDVSVHMCTENRGTILALAYREESTNERLSTLDFIQNQD